MGIYNHLEKLKYVTAIAEAGSIAKASKNLRISQPHLTRVIQQLEAELNTVLMIRGTTGISITPSGFRLQELERLIRHKTELFEREIRGAPTLKDEMIVGTYDSIARYFFPAFLKYVQVLHPKLTLHLETARSAQIAERVAQRKISMGVIVEQKFSAELQFMPIYEDTYEMFQASGVSQRSKNTLIYFHSWAEQVKYSQGKIGELKFRTFIEMDNLESIRSMVEQGMGIGVLPRYVSRQGLLDGRLSTLRPGLPKEMISFHRIGILTQAQAKLNSNESQFLEELTLFLKRWIEIK